MIAVRWWVLLLLAVLGLLAVFMAFVVGGAFGHDVTCAHLTYDPIAHLAGVCI